MASRDSLLSVELLTTRELDILRLIADGLSDREIAQELTLALETIKWFNKQIYSKFGVRNHTGIGALPHA